MENIQDLSFGKTCQEHLVPTKEMTSKQSLKKSAKSKMDYCQCLNLQSGAMQEKSWEMISQSLGECLMLNFGEYPKEEDVSTLSQILEVSVQEKYYLSQKACLGILRRAFSSWKDTTCGTRTSIEDASNSVVFENHGQDTRFKELEEIAPTVLSTYGTGGNNQPFVVSNVKSFDVRLTSEGTKNARANVYETDVSRTLDTGGTTPDRNQGGVAVVSYGIGRPTMNQGYNAKFSFQVEEEVEPTIVAAGASGVAHPVYSSSKASFFTSAEKEKANTLVATDYKDPPIVNEPQYIVRRLTPTECARLQGFPDWWCSELETENPTDEDIRFWREVFETHRLVIGKSTKPKSDNQIIKWLKNPHSDSAEYKMWGNGVALPNVVFVLSGIVWATQLEE